MDANDFLQKKGINPTNARKEILEVLLNSDKPLSYEEIKPKLSKGINKTTFYRNIDIFTQANFVEKIETKERVFYYEMSNPHAHFICNCCNEISCLKFKIPKININAKITSITIKGVCEKCEKEKFEK